MSKRILLATVLLAGACRTTAPNPDFATAQRPTLVENIPKEQESAGMQHCHYQSEKWVVMIRRDAIIIRSDDFNDRWAPAQRRREFKYSEAAEGKIIAYLTTSESVYILTSNGWIFATFP